MDINIVRLEGKENVEIENALSKAISIYKDLEIKDKRILISSDNYPPSFTFFKFIIEFLKSRSVISISVGVENYENHFSSSELVYLKENCFNVFDPRKSFFEKVEIQMRTSKRKIYKMSTPERRLIKNAYLSKSIFDNDYIIPVARFKMEPFSYFGGIWRAFFTLFSTKTTADLLIYRKDGLMEEAFFDVVSSFEEKLLFGLLDGRTLLYIPESYEEDFGFIVTSSDFESLDSFSSAMVGYKINSIPFNKVAYSRFKKPPGERAFFTDETVQSSRRNFRKPLAYQKSSSFFLSKWFAPLIIKTKTDSENYCFEDLLKCVDLCPVGAIFINGQNLMVDQKKCIKCLYCLSQCKENLLFI